MNHCDDCAPEFRECWEDETQCRKKPLAASPCSLHPHSVWAIWSEDGTECDLFRDREELERAIDPEETIHLAEYRLYHAEIIGQNTERSGDPLP